MSASVSFVYWRKMVKKEFGTASDPEFPANVFYLLPLCRRALREAQTAAGQPGGRRGRRKGTRQQRQAHGAHAVRPKHQHAGSGQHQRHERGERAATHGAGILSQHSGGVNARSARRAQRAAVAVQHQRADEQRRYAGKGDGSGESALCRQRQPKMAESASAVSASNRQAASAATPPAMPKRMAR